MFLLNFAENNMSLSLSCFKIQIYVVACLCKVCFKTLLNLDLILKLVSKYNIYLANSGSCWRLSQLQYSVLELWYTYSILTVQYSVLELQYSYSTACQSHGTATVQRARAMVQLQYNVLELYSFDFSVEKLNCGLSTCIRLYFKNYGPCTRIYHQNFCLC